MKIIQNRLRKKEFINNSLNVGLNKKLRNYDNLGRIIETPQKVDLFRNDTINLNLRKSLTLSSSIIAKRGSILIYSPLLSLREGKFKRYITNKWKHGLLSNFKVVNSNAEFPYFIVVMDSSKQQIVENEILRVQIPSLIINNSNNRRGGLYSVSGNNNKKEAVEYIAKLFATATSLGHLREVAKLLEEK